MSGSHAPVFHWLTKEETIARQKVERPLSGNRGHADPTADTAINRAYSWEKSKRREAQANDKKEKGSKCSDKKVNDRCGKAAEEVGSAEEVRATEDAKAAEV